MFLIPQIYLRDGSIVSREGTTSPIFQTDPVATATTMMDCGAEAIHCIDLNVTPMGTSPNIAAIKLIRKNTNLAVHVGGSFKTPQALEAYISSGVEMIVLGTVAYQQPAFLEEACKLFPGRIAVHIDVKASKVTIPGYAVVSNKTALDYAEKFIEDGVRYILFSDVGSDGYMADENYTNLVNFCKGVTARVICTSEIRDLSEIERISLLGIPKLDGLVLAKSIYTDRIDLRGAIAMVNDITLNEGDEPTLTEM
jgi:phosphoribosylformimino-5-aminoimidazole carboxamide ribotide isomerase